MLTFYNVLCLELADIQPAVAARLHDADLVLPNLGVLQRANREAAVHIRRVRLNAKHAVHLMLLGFSQSSLSLQTTRRDEALGLRCLALRLHAFLLLAQVSDHESAHVFLRIVTNL